MCSWKYFISNRTKIKCSVGNIRDSVRNICDSVGNSCDSVGNTTEIAKSVGNMLPVGNSVQLYI